MVPPAGRPREFDEQEVLMRALHAFWKHGYEATSVADLLEATGLKKGSLYQAFGDKHSLFLRTLADYLAQGRSSVEARLRGPGTLREQLADVMSVNDTQADQRRGCYAVNCLVEMAPHDPEVQGLLSEHFRILETVVMRRLEVARESGELESSLTPPQLARLLVVLLTGASAASKGHLDSGQANQTLRAALEHLL